MPTYLSLSPSVHRIPGYLPHICTLTEYWNSFCVQTDELLYTAVYKLVFSKILVWKYLYNSDFRIVLPYDIRHMRTPTQQVAKQFLQNFCKLSIDYSHLLRSAVKICRRGKLAQVNRKSNLLLLTCLLPFLLLMFQPLQLKNNIYVFIF